MKKLIFALFAMLVIASCSKENTPLPIPEVSMEAPAGVDLTQTIELTQGGSLTLKAISTNTETATYLWKVNNEKVGEAQEYTFTADKLGDYTIAATILNAEGNGTTIECKVTVCGPYRKGTFVLSEGNMTDLCGVLSFVSEKGEVTDSVYMRANPGRYLGNTTQDFCFYGDKIYIVSQNGDRTQGKNDGYLTVATTETMKYVTDYKKSEFGALKMPTHLIVVSAGKAYIRDINGIQIADLTGRTITGTIEGSKGASKLRMIAAAGNVYALSGKQLLVINPNSDAITKKIDLPGASSGVILDKNGKLWVSCTGSPSTIVNISTASNEIVQTNNIPEVSLSDGRNPSLGIGLCASKSEEAFFFKKGTKIYKHTYTGAGKTETLLDVTTEVPSGQLLYGNIGIHPVTNQLYVTSIEGYGTAYLNSNISVFDSKTGRLVKNYPNKVYFPASILFKTE